MSFQVLSRKYRPRLFGEVVGQNHITQALQNAIKNKSIGHAYLFTGTRGIGKTSVARIFAKALTCQRPQKDSNPCLKCSSCVGVDEGTLIDVQEIDGASHNGVENIRGLIENVQYLPSIGHYKVYIIDEVHMLSVPAFNALLKTLEEPPPHVIFILATTGPEKLLETVLSRCQRFDFRNAGTETLMGHLSEVLRQENIVIKEEGVLRQVCRQGRGSFRDALSLLEQILSYSTDGKITEETVTLSLGLARGSSLRLLTHSILKGDIEKLQSTYRQCLQENVDLKHLAQGVLDSFYFIIEHREDRQKLYNCGALEQGLLEEISSSELFWVFETLAKDFTWALQSTDPEKVLEVVLKKVGLRREFFSELGPINPGSAEGPSRDPIEDKELAKEKDEQKAAGAPTWEQFMEDTLEKYPALAANLEQGNIIEGPDITERGLYINIGFDHSVEVFLDYLKDSQIYQRLKEIVQNYFGVATSRIELSYVSSERRQKTNFQSRREIADKQLLLEQEKSKEVLLNNERIKEAQALFHSAVDKVVLDSD